MRWKKGWFVALANIGHMGVAQNFHQEGQTAGFGNHVSTYRSGSILEFRFFEPQPRVNSKFNAAGLGANIRTLWTEETSSSTLFAAKFDWA